MKKAIRFTTSFVLALCTAFSSVTFSYAHKADAEELSEADALTTTEKVERIPVSKDSIPEYLDVKSLIADGFTTRIKSDEQSLGEVVFENAEGIRSLYIFDENVKFYDENGDIFQTEYVLWSNFGLEKQDRDLQAYQLCAYVQQRLGMDSGALTKLHQQFASRSDYQQMLEMLQYDMLYGEQTVYHYVTKPQPTVLQMGVTPIAITGLRQIGDSLYILGSGFTEHSVAVIDGKDLPDDTIYINSGVLLLLETRSEAGETVAVSQCGKDGFALSTTAEYIVE